MRCLFRGGVRVIDKSTQAAIIPKEELFTAGGIDVGARLMQLTLGHAGLNNSQLQTLWCTFKSIAVLGNLIVTTFTAARGKSQDDIE